MKTLKKYIGKYRVIAPYAWDDKNQKYYFLNLSDGIGAEDYFIPLRITPRKNDWGAMSNVSIDDGELYIYVAGLRAGKSLLENLEKVCEVLSYEISDVEYIIRIPTKYLEDKSVIDLLRPWVSGKSFGPKDTRNLPDTKKRCSQT